VVTPIGTRALTRRQVVGLTVAVVAVELFIALPFLSVPPHDARGIPGPLLIVTSLTGAFFLGPVIGFGLTGAAAVATHLRAAWRALAVAGTPARAIVGILNETLEAEQRYSPGIKFATACVGSLSADGREACFVLAGHPPPILIADGTARPVAASPGPPMGLRRNGPWEAYNLHLPDPPWTLLLYTDGLIEGRAAPESVERYGPDRLAAAAAGLGAPLEEIDVEALLAAVRAANGRPMADDMVVLVLSAQAAARPMAPAVVERSG